MHRLTLGAFWQRKDGAKCISPVRRLNAPFGARCFLTRNGSLPRAGATAVLMHRLALGAF